MGKVYAIYGIVPEKGMRDYEHSSRAMILHRAEAGTQKNLIISGHRL
jgi:hypothetical protein